MTQAAAEIISELVEEEGNYVVTTDMEKRVREPGDLRRSSSTDRSGSKTAMRRRSWTEQSKRSAVLPEMEEAGGTTWR